jgi:hypothetical protein
MRKETTEIRQQDSHGKSHTVQVEVRKKRVLVKREAPEAARTELSSVPAFPVAAGSRVTEKLSLKPLIEVSPPVEVENRDPNRGPGSRCRSKSCNPSSKPGSQESRGTAGDRRRQNRWP